MNFRKNLFLGPLMTSLPCIIIIVTDIQVKCDFWVLFLGLAWTQYLVQKFLDLGLRLLKS